MSTSILPLAVWPENAAQARFPANDNSLRIEAAFKKGLSFSTAEPSTPADRDQHVIGTAWGGFAVDSIVVYLASTWHEFVPFEGLIKRIGTKIYEYTSTGWEEVDSGGGGGSSTQVICIAASDETTPITAGVGKVTLRMPFAMTDVSVRASLTSAQATNGGGGIFTVDINEGGVSILSTKLTIDNTEKTSTTAATPPVVSDTSLADDAEITIDVDQVGDGTAAGLKVYIKGTV